MTPDAADPSAGPWRAALARHRELGLAAVFVAMAGWELVEFVALEAPHGPVGPLTLALHSMQVLLVAGITALAVRAWRERTRQEALGWSWTRSWPMGSRTGRSARASGGARPP